MHIFPAWIDWLNLKVVLPDFRNIGRILSYIRKLTWPLSLLLHNTNFYNCHFFKSSSFIVIIPDWIYEKEIGTPGEWFYMRILALEAQVFYSLS